MQPTITVEGVRIGRRRAGRLMRLMGLQTIYRAPRTSAPHPEHRGYPYLLRGLAARLSEEAGHLSLPPPTPRSTIISTRNVIFTTARTSNLIAPPHSPCGVNLRPDFTDYIFRRLKLRLSDNAYQSTKQLFPGLALVPRLGSLYGNYLCHRHSLLPRQCGCATAGSVPMSVRRVQTNMEATCSISL